MELESLKRSLLVNLTIFGVIGTLLVICAYGLGNQINNNGLPFALEMALVIGVLFILCEYMSYQTAKYYVIDERDQTAEMFVRYSGV